MEKALQALEMLRKASELASLPKQDHVALEQAYQFLKQFIEKPIEGLKDVDKQS